MTDYGPCQVGGCEQPVEYLLDFDRQPRQIRVCADCYHRLAEPVDSALRL